MMNKSTFSRSIHFLVLPICIASLLLASSCKGKKGDGEEISLSQKLLPSSRGLTGEVILVMDSAKWNGELGSVIRDTYRTEFDGLPQNEPLFNLRYVSPKKFNSVLEKVRNLIFVATIDGQSYEDKLMRGYFTKGSLEVMKNKEDAFFFSKQNVYAKDQQVVYLFNRDTDQLIKKIKENQQMLRDFSYNAELKRLKSDVLDRKNKVVEKMLLKEHGFSMHVPKGFEVAKNVKNFVWLRLLENEYEQNLFVYYRPFANQDVFSDIELLREEITQTYIRDIEKPEIYLTYQEKIPFDTKEINFKGAYAKKTRGLWKLSDISAGGPFLSYVFVDESKQRLYYIEGYTYAAGMKKRNFMMELEVVLNSFSFKD